MMSENVVLVFKAKSIVSIEQGVGRLSLVLFQPEPETRELILDQSSEAIDFEIIDDSGTFYPDDQMTIVNVVYGAATDTLVVEMMMA